MTWIKGQSGNPAGRKKATVSLSEELAALLNKKGTDGIRHKDKMAQELVALMHHPDANIRLKAITAVYDRIEGKPKQALEHSQDPDHPVGIGVVAIDYRQSIAALAPVAENATGPVDDSDPSSEG